MQDQLLDQGIELLVFGMGTVFVFLAVLVLITMFMSFIVLRFFPEAAVVKKARTSKAPVNNKQNNDELVAVISAAIHKHRAHQK